MRWDQNKEPIIFRCKISAHFCIAVLYIAIFIFYGWTASQGNFNTLTFNKNPVGYHGLLADAFAHGQVSLMRHPIKQLTQLADPYDPVTNIPYRFHDVSLFKDKYYLYFTPAVALFILLPFKMITGYFISEPLLTALLCYIGFLAAFFTLKKILSIIKVSLDPWMEVVIFIALAFNTAVPCLLRRPLFYELSIASSYAALMMAFYCFTVGVTATQKLGLKAGLFGALLGLTILSRPNQFLTCTLLAIAFVVVRGVIFRESRRKLFQVMIMIGLPIFITLMGMAYYNFHRYGSITEFGQSYQLAGYNPKFLISRSISYIPLNIYIYLTTVPQLDTIFPFVHLVQGKLLYHFHEYHKAYTAEALIGLPGFPIYWLIFFPLFYLSKMYRAYPFGIQCGVIFLLCGCLSLVGTSVVCGSTMRYLVDISPPFLLSILLLWILILQYLTIPFRLWMRRLFCFIVIASSLVSFLGSLPPYEYLWSPPVSTVKKVFQDNG